MPVDARDREVIEDMCRAMQAGPGHEDELLALFSNDAVLVEPFTGRVQTHTGKSALRTAVEAMSKDRAPDFTLTLDRVDVEGDSLRAEWTCTSAVLPSPMRGYDLLKIRSGLIHRLEIIVTEMPGFPT